MQNSSFLWLVKHISWLKHSAGVAISDKLLLFFIKLYYISLRIVLRLALGKRRSKRLILNRGLDLGTLWYESFSFWKRGEKKSHELLKFKMPKYNFEFYCRKNKDDFKTMTFHEEDILDYHFTPKEGDIVVDVGAHVGPYTIIASKRVGPNGKVVSIEADPDNFDLLSRNIQLNKLSNVIALNYAVYSKEERIKLYLPSGGAGEKSSYTKYNTIMSDRAHGEEKFVEVKANTLDYLLQSNMIKQEEVNWIKIDVEGAEYEVLKGAKEILSKSSDISLLIEIHNLSAGNVLYKLIRELLSLYNFKIDFEKASESGERHIIARKR
jgi:FkbM family methyltransferase